MSVGDAPDRAAVNTIFENRLNIARDVDAALKTQFNPENPAAFINEFYDKIASRVSSGEAQLGSGEKILVIYPTKHYEQQKNSFNALTNIGAQSLIDQLNQRHQHLIASHDEYNGALLPLGAHFEASPTVMTTNTNRTDATPLQRLIKQPFFSNMDAVKDHAVIIFDDHSEAGSFTTTLANTVYSTAKSVLGVVTLSASPYTHGGIYSSPELQNFVRELLDARAWGPYAQESDEVEEAPSDYFDAELRNLGLSIKTLTTYEALVIAAMLVDSNSEQEIQKFNRLNPAEQASYKGVIAEGDSASNLLADHPMSAPEIVSRLATLMLGARSER